MRIQGGFLVFSPGFSQDFQTKPSKHQNKLERNSPNSRNFQEVFKHFDENGDQKLNAQEMLAFDSWSSGHFCFKDHFGTGMIMNDPGNC